MKESFIIILCLLIGLAAHSQKDSTRGEQYRLTGRIKNKVQLTPDCGDIAWGTVMEFEVINLVGMTFPNKSIGIIITCPEFYKKGLFEKDKTYQLVFSNKNQADFGWVIPNKNLLKKNGLSFDPYVVSIKKTP